METVQLQCGHCKQVMAISVAHLGGQVRCPHCKGVVQTPPRPAAAAPAPPPPPAPPPEPEPVVPKIEIERHESIFSGPESSDAVLGDAPAPKVEFPLQDQPASASEAMPSAEAPAESEEATFAQFKPRPVYTSGVLQLIALIFLVPYAVVMTAFVVYLLFFGAPRSVHPLDMLPDPVESKKGGAPRPASKKIVNTTELAAHQFVPIGKTIQIGDISVTPERVRLTESGDLKLFLRAKNISPTTAFDPINEFYVRYNAAKPGTEPYSFVETKSHNFANLYGAYLGYLKNVEDTEEPRGEALLRPGQETTIVLKTYENHEKQITKLVAAKENLVWRVQVRRGLVKYKNRDVSTTAVIGVEFNAGSVETEAKKT